MDEWIYPFNIAFLNRQGCFSQKELRAIALCTILCCPVVPWVTGGGLQVNSHLWQQVNSAAKIAEL